MISILVRFGFRVVSQEGSHIKLRRTAPDGGRQTVMVARRRQIPTGTLFGIYREACKYVPEAELRPWFYAD